MTRRELLLEVYKHKNIGYVPCFFTDFNYAKPTAILERAERGGFDWFGVEWEYVDAVKAPMVKPGTQRLKDITRWREELTFPDLSAVDWERAGQEATAGWDLENKISSVTLINGPFERTHALMGFEDAMCAMYDEPECFQELVDAITDYKIEMIQIIGTYYRPDVLCFHDDYGADDMMLMSVDMWETFFKEPLRRIIQATHEAGMIYEHHSCGYIAPIFDQLVEIGIDAINPLQIKNPIREMKDKYQDRVTFLGGYDNQNVFDRAGVSEEEIRQEVRRVLEELAPGGSFITKTITISRDFIPVFIDEHMKHANDYQEERI